MIFDSDSDSESKPVDILDSEVEDIKQNMKYMEDKLKESINNAEIYVRELAALVDYAQSKDAELEQL